MQEDERRAQYRVNWNDVGYRDRLAVKTPNQGTRSVLGKPWKDLWGWDVNRELNNCRFNAERTP